MASGRPEDGAQDEAAQLEAARGRLRDAMGSVRNLSQLLQSVRVGPRAIESVLPDVHASCEVINASTRSLIETIAARLPDRGATDELLAFMVPRATELERELSSAIGKSINAKLRLGLERAVLRLSGELDAGRSLLDTLNEAVQGGLLRAGLGSLLEGSRQTRGDEGRVEVRVPSRLESEVLVNPRLFVVLLGFGAGLVQGASGASASMTLEAAGNSRTLTVMRTTASGPTVSLPTLPLIAPTLACARAAARASHAELAWDEEAARFTLSLSA